MIVLRRLLLRKCLNGMDQFVMKKFSLCGFLSWDSLEILELLAVMNFSILKIRILHIISIKESHITRCVLVFSCILQYGMDTKSF